MLGNIDICVKICTCKITVNPCNNIKLLYILDFIKPYIKMLVNQQFNCLFKVSKVAKIRNRYNQVPHLTQDTNGKVTNSQLDTTNESQEVSPFPAGDHKAQINRRAQRHSKHKTEQKHKRSTKKYRLGTVRKFFTGGLKPVKRRANLTLNSDVDQDT